MKSGFYPYSCCTSLSAREKQNLLTADVVRFQCNKLVTTYGKYKKGADVFRHLNAEFLHAISLRACEAFTSCHEELQTGEASES